MKTLSCGFEFCVTGGVSLDVLWVCRLEAREKKSVGQYRLLNHLFFHRIQRPISSNTFAFFFLCIYLLSGDRIGMRLPGFSKTKWIFFFQC